MANLEDEKMNPGQVLIGLLGLTVFVVLFCFIVWKVTHAGHTNVVINQNVENIQDEVSGMPDEDDWEAPSSDQLASGEDDTDPSEGGNDDVTNMSFTTVDEVVTAKDVTNLRSEPSTTQGKATVVTQLKNGAYAKRIGINDATGWSKLEYEGQILYAVTQYLILQEDENQITEE